MNNSSEQVRVDEALGETERLHRQVSRMLVQAQKELHDAIFAMDGSAQSLDRFASARAELDSAEAWALYVVKKVRRPAPRASGAVASS